MVVAILVQHRYSTDTALDTNWIEMNNYEYHDIVIDG